MSEEVSYPVVRGTKIRQFRGGQGQPVVFLHGAAGLSVWTPFFQGIAAEYDLRVPEHPGFGQSDNPEWLASVADLVLFYLDYLSEHDLRDVHLVANSFGGWVAAELAARDSTRLRSLTLIGPAGIAPPEGAPDVLRWSYEDSTRKLFHNPAIAERMLSQTVATEQLSAILKNQTTVARLGSALRLVNPDLPRWLHRVGIPAHVIWGEHDKVFPAHTSKLWTEALPNARSTIIRNAGHLPHAEKADDTIAATLRFLREAS